MQVPRVSFSNESSERGFDRALRASEAELDAPTRDLATQREATSRRDEEPTIPVTDAGAAQTEVARSERTVGETAMTATETATNAEVADAAARRVGTAEAGQAREAGTSRVEPSEEGETARRTEAGKGAASPASIALEERLHAQARTTPVRGALAISGPGTAAATTAAAPRNTGTPLLEKSLAGPRTESPATTTATYRTFNKQTLELAEQARDSVFKQIAMHLGQERGEVRMLLDPPDLGQLDVRMAIDDAGRLTLSMFTERPELAVMLDKHMPELARSLAQNGLTITQTAVQQQSQDSRRRDHDSFGQAQGAKGSDGASDDDSTPRIEELARRGFFTAEGFDFWV